MENRPENLEESLMIKVPDTPEEILAYFTQDVIPETKPSSAHKGQFVMPRAQRRALARKYLGKSAMERKLEQSAIARGTKRGNV
jgi:hypothetical protein